jgi:hypothetical protein
MGYSPATPDGSKLYNIVFKDGKSTLVRANDVVDALNTARKVAVNEFAAAWAKSVVSASPQPEPSDCAVDQNEVKCTLPGCSGPYNCKERGLDGVQ